MDVSPSVAGGSAGRFGVDDMLPLPLLGVGVQLGFALTRHGGLDVVWSFDGFLIVFHTLRLLCVILVNVMTSSQKRYSSKTHTGGEIVVVVPQ